MMDPTPLMSVLYTVHPANGLIIGRGVKVIASTLRSVPVECGFSNDGGFLLCVARDTQNSTFLVAITVEGKKKAAYNLMREVLSHEKLTCRDQLSYSVDSVPMLPFSKEVQDFTMRHKAILDNKRSSS